MFNQWLSTMAVSPTFLHIIVAPLFSSFLPAPSSVIHNSAYLPPTYLLFPSVVYPRPLTNWSSQPRPGGQPCTSPPPSLSPPLQQMQPSSQIPGNTHIVLYTISEGGCNLYCFLNAKPKQKRIKSKPNPRKSRAIAKQTFESLSNIFFKIQMFAWLFHFQKWKMFVVLHVLFSQKTLLISVVGWVVQFSFVDRGPL